MWWPIKWLRGGIVEKHSLCADKSLVAMTLPPPHAIIRETTVGVEVEIVPHASMSHPVRISWVPEPHSLQKLGKMGVSVPIGTYACTAIDDQGLQSDTIMVRVHAHPPVCPRILRYQTTGASGEMSRDGSVTAFLDGVPQHSTCTLMWSTGTVTTELTLRNVRPGMYTAIVITVDGQHVSCLHGTHPAQVDCAHVLSCQSE